MAHTAIGQIGPNDAYDLGSYHFTVAYDYDQSLNATILQALCGREGHELKAATKKVANQAEIVSWSIEANDTTVDVYAAIFQSNSEPIDIQFSEIDSLNYSYYYEGKYWPNIALWSNYHARVFFSGLDAKTQSPVTLQYDREKDIYCGYIDLSGSSLEPIYGPVTENGYLDFVPYGNAKENGKKTILIARFSINAYEAGATGPDSFWIDPLDWNADPTTVLNLTVNGALSGRHNDPLNENADYSYIPADQSKATGYGCGGNGGHGGGGGAGASTIVVNRFATDRANSKNIVTKPKRHGYGSGGGKGGEGGDGCILIYY